ncbi:MAG: cysteine--tRNA ligase [Verrucomicrobia bacterium]|nr:cysteine--tRNA ligase [Verrucomicrobiota bacterium]
MKIFNTYSRQLEEFVPRMAGQARMYTCGPTVYNYAHIGNFRAYMFEDLLRRQLRAAGFRVTQVMNLTDVDDKTIRGARQAGVSLNDFTGTFKKAFFEDLAILQIEPAEHYPAATDHVPEMIALIAKLIEAGHAYQSDDRSVYYRVKTFADYGRLAHLDMSGLQSSGRVSQDEYDKESVGDFAVWKAWDEADGEVVWDSPWGRGRPGWHIECSAMSIKHLGESFDLHTGGVDNIFPHHENEIAQSEGATGCKPFVRYWMHCGYLVVDGAKMSKSMGNFYTLRDLMARGYTGREIRYVLLTAQYRQQLNFTFAALDGARASLARVDEFRGRLVERASGAAAGAAPEWVVKRLTAFQDAMAEDLNTPVGLAALFDLITDGNRAMDQRAVDAGAAGAAVAALDRMDAILGVLAAPEAKPDTEAEALLAARTKARAERNWAEADRIRAALAAKGWDVRDSAEGVKLKPRHA